MAQQIGVQRSLTLETLYTIYSVVDPAVSCKHHFMLLGGLTSGGSALGPGGTGPPNRVAIGPNFSRTLDTLWSIDSPKN